MCGCLTKFGEILHEAYVYREKKSTYSLSEKIGINENKHRHNRWQ